MTCVRIYKRVVFGLQNTRVLNDMHFDRAKSIVTNTSKTYHYSLLHARDETVCTGKFVRMKQAVVVRGGRIPP